MQNSVSSLLAMSCSQQLVTSSSSLNAGVTEATLLEAKSADLARPSYILEMVVRIKTEINNGRIRSSLDNLTQHLMHLSYHSLTSQDNIAIFSDRTASIVGLCEICASHYFPTLSVLSQVNLLRVLHFCLDDYIYFQFICPESAPKILESTRAIYLSASRELTSLYQRSTDATAGKYEMAYIIEGLKGITTEYGFWRQAWESAKKFLGTSGSTIALCFALCKFVFHTVHNMPSFWQARVWAISNFTRLLLDHPNEVEFCQLIAYMRYALENNQGDWQVGYAVGDALVNIIRNCPAEHLRSLAFYNALDRQYLIAAYSEEKKIEAKVAPTFAEIKTEAKDAKVAELKVETKEGSQQSFYVDLQYLLGECQKTQTDRYPAFYNDCALYSTVQGMLYLCANADHASWVYYTAERERQILAAMINAEASWLRNIINSIYSTEPFLRKLLDQYHIQKQEEKKAAITEAKAYSMPDSSILPFAAVILDPPEIKNARPLSLGSCLNRVRDDYTAKRYANFAQGLEDLRTRFVEHPNDFTAEESIAFYIDSHLLARMYLSSGMIREAKSFCNNLNIDQASVATANLRVYAGDSYFLQALAKQEGYFATEPLYEQALNCFLKIALPDEKVAEALSNRINYLKLQVEFWHIYQNLEQEVQCYQIRPQLTFPLQTVIQRIKPLASHLLEFKLTVQLDALYQLLSPAVNDFVQSKAKQKSETHSAQDYKDIELMAKQLWFHRQTKLAGIIYGSDGGRYTELKSACSSNEPYPFADNEFKFTETNLRVNLSTVRREDLAGRVQTIVTATCQEAVAKLGNPLELKFDLVVYGALSQGTLQLGGKIDFAILIAKEAARYSNYFRDLLALIKIHLQLAFYPQFDFGNLQYPACIELIKTPDEMLDYCYLAAAQPKMDAGESRYQLLKPIVVYSNNEAALSTGYTEKIAAKTELNKHLAVTMLQVHALRDMNKLARLERFLCDLALYYDVTETNILSIIATLKSKQLFVAEFIDQLEAEAKDLLAGRDNGYLVAALPNIISAWIQPEVPVSIFDPMLLAWEISHKDLALNGMMVVALAQYLVRKKKCLDLATHLKYFSEVPTANKREYFITLSRAFAEVAAEHQARFQAILANLSEQPDEYGERVGTINQREAFADIMQNELTTEAKECKANQNYVLLEWMDDTSKQKVQRLLKPAVQQQLFDAKLQPDSSKRTPDGKRIVILVKADQSRDLAYFKFYPERPGVQLQVDALTRRIVGYALNWKLCRIVVVQGEKTTTYPVLISEPAGISLKDICNGRISNRDFKSTCDNLDRRTYSLLMLSRLIIDPEDDQFSNFVVQGCKNLQLQDAYRLVCVDGDHAFDEALVKDKKGKERVNLKSYLFCMDQMLQLVDARAITEFCSLRAYRLLLKWLEEIIEYDRLHIMRANMGLFALTGNPSEVESYFRPILETQANTELPSTYIPSMMMAGMVRDLFQKIVQIQEILNSTPNITHFDLLVKMNKNLAAYYRAALALRVTPWARFESLPHNYDPQKLVVPTSTAIIQKKSSIQDIRFIRRAYSTVVMRPEKAVSIQDMFTEFKRPEYPVQLWQRLTEELCKVYVLYQEKTVQSALLAGDVNLLQNLQSDRLVEHVINNLDFGRIEEKQNAVVRKILQSITKVGYATLKLPGCKALDDDLLYAILKTSNQMLLNLDLSNCPKLTAKSLVYIAEYCPHLHKLIISGTNIEFIGDRSF